MARTAASNSASAAWQEVGEALERAVIASPLERLHKDLAFRRRTHFKGKQIERINQAVRGVLEVFGSALAHAPRQGGVIVDFVGLEMDFGQVFGLAARPRDLCDPFAAGDALALLQVFNVMKIEVKETPEKEVGPRGEIDPPRGAHDNQRPLAPPPQTGDQPPPH